MTTVTLDNYVEECILPVDKRNIRGFRSKHDVLNFLNLPYAAATVRFRPALPMSLRDLPASYDATTYGSRCPQESGTLHMAMKHMFEQMSAVDQVSDEVACLNLNIYTPSSTLSGTSCQSLPVFVWIHGGAFNTGDNTVQFDGNHLVQKSVEIRAPIVLVTVNYRLNVLGFISSVELREEARAMGQTHVPNLDLHDQRLALQWIQSNIRFFGGDPARVTLCGESAGGLSVLCHLKAGIPQLFVYRIDCPDPFPGDLEGYSWHSYGIPFTFNQPPCRTRSRLLALQNSVTSAFLTFLHGSEPWPLFNQTQAIRHWTCFGEELITTS